MATRFFKPVLREAVIVALAGAVLAFAANALSPRGVDLRRVYLADKSEPPVPPGPGASATNAPLTEEEATVAHLKEKGLQIMDTAQVRALSKDIRFQEETVIFIDVRDTEHYEAGHIPSAYNFDFNYHLDQVGQLLPACGNAQQIVVYCNGGKCDTSEAAALFMRDSVKIPAEKLYVYTGGIADWTKKGFPIESGARNSGNLKDSAHAK